MPWLLLSLPEHDEPRLENLADAQRVVLVWAGPGPSNAGIWDVQLVFRPYGVTSDTEGVLFPAEDAVTVARGLSKEAASAIVLTLARAIGDSVFVAQGIEVIRDGTRKAAYLDDLVDRMDLSVRQPRDELNRAVDLLEEHMMHAAAQEMRVALDRKAAYLDDLVDRMDLSVRQPCDDA